MKDLINAREKAKAKRQAAETAREEAAKPFHAAVIAAQKEEQEAEEKLREMRSAEIVRHIDVLLLLRPEHDYRDCNDENKENSHRCSRCALLHVKMCECNTDEIDVDISVQFNRTR